MRHKPVFIDAAFEHFAAITSATADEALDPDIQDSVGLVSYVVATTNPPPAELRELYEQLRPVMNGLASVVVSAVITRAAGDARMLHDRSTWRAPLAAVVKAFCSGLSAAERNYDERIRGTDLPAKTIDILTDSRVGRQAALDGFTCFLQSQGQIINEEIEPRQPYQYACLSVVHKIVQAGDGRWSYLPKLEAQFTQFTPAMLNLTSCCESNSRYLFKFDVNVMSGAFMTASWESSAKFRGDVESFIRRFRRTDIASSANYFEGEFQSAPSHARPHF